MSVFTRVFNVLARRNHVPSTQIESDEYQRPVSASAPMPSGEWSIIVDQNGDKVTTRQPVATDMLARPSVAVLFGGTLPKFEGTGDRLKNLPGLIDYETRAQANKEYLDKAIFLLSQTDDGRRLLELARTNKFTIVFDPVRAEREGAVGLCDFKEKLIPLAEGRSPAEVALTLKHELQHMEDMSKGAGYSTADTPKSARMTDRAMEANARVSEAVAASEALLGSPRGPAQQFRTPALFRNFWQKNQPMAEQAHAALPMAKQGKWKEFAAKVFPAYFKQTQTLDYYDTRYAEYLKSATPDISDDQKKAEKGEYHEREQAKRRLAQAEAGAKALFTRDKGAEDITGAILLRGTPYLDATMLETGPAQQVAPKALPILTQVKERLAKILPGTDKAKLLDAPLRDLKPQPVLPNPYKAQVSDLSGRDDFQPIILPSRIDGAGLTSGRKLNAEVTQFMADAMKNMRSGRTDTDRLNYCITDYIHRGAGTANLRGLVGDLLEAGLRAPVAAFPQEYLHDLYGRMYRASEAGSTGDNSPLSRQELKLIRHWQDMQDKGLDPVWINKENKAQSNVGSDREIALYAGHLVKGLKTAVQTPVLHAVASSTAPSVSRYV